VTLLGFFGELKKERIYLNLKVKHFCKCFSCRTVGQLFAGMNRSNLWYSYNHFNKKKEREEAGKE